MNYQILLPILVGIAILFGCNSTKDVNSTPAITKSDMPGKIMVLLDRTVSPKKLEVEMSAYELKSEGQISRAEHRFMFTFNSNKIKSKELIQKINALSYASEAAIPQQFNR